MKKIVVYALCALMLASAPLQCQPTLPVPDEKAMEELFKGVDFEKLLKDVESALEKAETEKDDTTATVPAWKQQPDFWHTPFAPTGAVIQQPVTGIKDRRSLVLDPTFQTVTPTRGQATTIPTDEAFYAYQGFMDDFIGILTSIDKKIAASRTYSPAFKESFAAYCQKVSDALVIAHERVESKKIYTKVLLAPPENNKKLVTDMKRLRRMIVDAYDVIKRLDAKITRANEEQENITLLQQLAQQTPVQQPQAQEPEKQEPAKEPEKEQPEQAVAQQPEPEQDTKDVSDREDGTDMDTGDDTSKNHDDDATATKQLFPMK